MGIELTASLLRKQLVEFRREAVDYEASIHIVSAEIAVGLIEFKLKVDRSILESEFQWFKAGFFLDMVVGNTKWAEIVDLYYELVTQAEENGYIKA